jgi:hypothetical protein
VEEIQQERVVLLALIAPMGQSRTLSVLKVSFRTLHYKALARYALLDIIVRTRL